MAFWNGLALFAILMIVIEKLIPRYKMLVPIIFLIVLTFFGMFRYQIGTDYDWYTELYYLTKMGDIYPEQSFILIATFLRSMGFSYQMLFIVYELAIMIMLWLSIRRYTKLPEQMLLMGICFLTLQYFSSLNGIRQALSVVIVFWAYEYVKKRQFIPYLISVIVASFFHISSLVGIVIYFLPRREYNYRYYLIIFISVFILAKLNLVLGFLLKVTPLLGIESRYLSYLSTADSVDASGLYVIVQFILFSIGRIAVKEIRPNDYPILHVIFLGLLMNYLFTFSLPIMRISKVFDYFWVFLFPVMIIYLNNFLSIRFKTFSIRIFLGYGLVIYLLMISLVSISKIPNDYNGNWNNTHPSSMNINYDFNFKLFDNK